MIQTDFNFIIMKVYTDLSQIQFNRNRAITVGTFDGVHIGHIAIINNLTVNAKKKNLSSLLITFEPHPQIFFQKRHNENYLKFPLLTTIDEKISILEKTNIDEVLIIDFEQNFANLSAREFITNFLMQKFGFKYFAIGFNHCFGKNREGNYQLLMQIQEEFKTNDNLSFEVEEIKQVKINSKNISSTEIRKLLIQENSSDDIIKKCNEILGYEYFVFGKVCKGKELGKKLGFPTANLEIFSANKLLPKNGVYFCSIEIETENYCNQKFFGVANIGIQPTITKNFDNQISTLEVHILDFSDDIYGKNIKVSFINFIRNEFKFDNIDKLIEQINKDIALCKQLLA